MNNQIITFICPSCNKEVTLELDNSFNILSIKHNDEIVILSESEQIELLQKHGIELG